MNVNQPLWTLYLIRQNVRLARIALTANDIVTARVHLDGIEKMCDRYKPFKEENMTLPTAHGSISLAVKRSEPVYHCAHPNDGHSVRVTNLTNDDFTVYLDGTPEELIDWATKVRFVAIRLLTEITKPEEMS